MTPGSVDLAASQLVGRDVEAARVDAMLERLAEGGAALVVSGEAGVGKSALLGYARARAEGLGLRALSSLGVESEAQLAFAGLHQLLIPVLKLLELLPAPQRGALEVAFGIASGPEPDLFLVALAAYQLVCDAAEERPLVILADDAHWLDRSSVRVLAFTCFMETVSHVRPEPVTVTGFPSEAAPTGRGVPHRPHFGMADRARSSTRFFAPHFGQVMMGICAFDDIARTRRARTSNFSKKKPTDSYRWACIFHFCVAHTRVFNRRVFSTGGRPIG